MLHRTSELELDGVRKIRKKECTTIKEIALEKKVGQMSKIRRYLAHEQILVDFLWHVLLLLHSANTHRVTSACKLMVEHLDTMACNCLSFPGAHRNA